MISISATEEAVSWLKKNKTATYFYLGLVDYGCNGKGYDLKFVDQLAEGDHNITILEEDLLIATSKKDAPLLQGLILKMVQDGAFGSRLVLENPNVRNECGCGKSVNF